MSDVATETEAGAKELRFKRVFVVVSVALAVLGIILIFTDQAVAGIILIAAALLFGLFTRRRTRLADGGG